MNVKKYQKHYFTKIEKLDKYKKIIINKATNYVKEYIKIKIHILYDYVLLIQH